MTPRPVNRCAERGCPVIGYWPEGGYCPLHADRAAARPPSLLEAWATDSEGR